MVEKLTEAELSALEQCGNGCDVLGYGMARHLRAVERKRPELIDICPAMGEYGVKDKHPYFGAISTAEGKREVEAWRKRLKKGKSNPGKPLKPEPMNEPRRRVGALELP